MPLKPNTKRKIIPTCDHEYIRTNGTTTCKKCNIKSITYLTTLKN